MPCPPARRLLLALVGTAIIAAAAYALHARLLSANQALALAAFGGVVIDSHFFLARIADLRAAGLALTDIVKGGAPDSRPPGAGDGPGA